MKKYFILFILILSFNLNLFSAEISNSNKKEIFQESLKIEGIYYTEDNPIAYINGKEYHLNDTICKGKILNISADKIIIKFGNIEKTYSVGASISGLKQENSFEILDEKIVDAPLKTSIVRYILLKGNLSKQIITDFIWKQYNLLKNKKGFKFHTTPTNIGLYLFISKEHYKSNMGQWLAMLYHRLDKGTPKITYALDFQGQLESLTVKPEIKFNLSENQRKTVWKKSIYAHDKAWNKIEKLYPRNQFDTLEKSKTRAEFAEELYEKHISKLLKKYKLTRKQLNEIDEEAFKKGWAMPPEKY